MATLEDISRTYDWMDRLFRLRQGDNADITCAFFNGDFRLTLEEAQRAKHDMILDGIGFQPGMRILDIGCGWGPIVKAVRERAGEAVGLTLSPAQAKYCQSQGHDVRLMDYKDAGDKLGHFDGVVSVGAFEHFCSPEQYLDGEQDQIYREFFQFCDSVLPPQGRLFLQSMMWGKRVPDPEQCTLDAPEGSDELIVARLMAFYPGSWIPTGKDQVVEASKEDFDFLSSSNGRLDYIETLKRWTASSKNLRRPDQIHKTILAIAALLPRLLQRNFRTQMSCVFHNDQRVVFEQEIFTHERMFFEKKAA